MLSRNQSALVIFVGLMFLRFWQNLIVLGDASTITQHH